MWKGAPMQLSVPFAYTKFSWFRSTCRQNQFLTRIIFQLGVNGYSFAVNNNGYILYHPDLRPMVSMISGQRFVNICAFD